MVGETARQRKVALPPTGPLPVWAAATCGLCVTHCDRGDSLGYVPMTSAAGLRWRRLGIALMAGPPRRQMLQPGRWPSRRFGGGLDRASIGSNRAGELILYALPSAIHRIIRPPMTMESATFLPCILRACLAACSGLNAMELSFAHHGVESQLCLLQLCGVVVAHGGTSLLPCLGEHRHLPPWPAMLSAA